MTVLIIDDERDTRELLQRALEKAGYQVICAEDGRSGLELAVEHQPDVITLDVRMPEMDGWSVLTILKEHPSLTHIPVVLLTMVDDPALGNALGAAAYLTKPVESARLLKVLGKYCPPQSGFNILVVEDDSNSQEMMVRFLNRAGWQTRTATNGVQALNMLSTASIGLILLDLMMPEMDGFDFLRRIRQHPEWMSIPVIIISAKELTASDHLKLGDAAQGFHQKGNLDKQQLLADIKEFSSMSYSA